MIYPGLKITGTSPVISKIVDSRPMALSPPSIIISTRPSRSSDTCEYRVAEGLPDLLALGAAIANPQAFIRLRAILSEGHLTATVDSPPVVSSGISGFFFKTKVSGPGQNRDTRAFAPSGISTATPSNSSASAI